jgi:hypothetical protein
MAVTELGFEGVDMIHLVQEVTNDELLKTE